MIITEHSSIPGFELVSRGADVPENADYCLTLTDSTMEPFLPCGTMVYITTKLLPKEFQAGIFLYENEVICRQWCEDYSGTMHLLCPDRKNIGMNISIPARDRAKCLCLGAVITDIFLPPPEYF